MGVRIKLTPVPVFTYPTNWENAFVWKVYRVLERAARFVTPSEILRRLGRKSTTAQQERVKKAIRDLRRDRCGSWPILQEDGKYLLAA